VDQAQYLDLTGPTLTMVGSDEIFGFESSVQS